MDLKEQRKLKEDIKGGSMGALIDIVKDMQTESLKRYKMTPADHRYYQSRVNVLDELLKLLPSTPE